MTPDNSATRRPTPTEIASLAATMDRIVPEPMSVGFGPSRIEISAGGIACRYVEVWDRDLSLADFAIAALAALQEEIIEEVTHTGWPPADPTRPEAPQSGKKLPRPGADVTTSTLRCWYGERDHPALVLHDVPISGA